MAGEIPGHAYLRGHMDTYQMTLDYLLRQTIVQDWPALQDVLNKASSKRPRDWQLPVLACRTAGGSSEQAIPASAAIACLQISIILIDDMLDADPRGEHHYIGAPAAANLAVVFYAIGLGHFSEWGESGAQISSSKQTKSDDVDHGLWSTSGRSRC